jgi:hypothetical protein
MAEESITTLDQTGRDFRRSYFFRRSMATLHEFSEALLMLDETDGFAVVKARFDRAKTKGWTKSICFFKRRSQRLKDFRHDFGGHFGYPPSWFAINHLSNTEVAIELASDPVREKANIRFRFVSELVAIGMHRHSKVDDVADHFRSMFRLSLAAYGHSARCSQILAVHDLWARFE